jgi:DNA-binding transcriptional MerR regulator
MLIPFVVLLKNYKTGRLLVFYIWIMALLEKETEKLFYSIGEVAEMFDVNTSLIRFWEKEFDVITPSKNKKGNRLFTKKDIENFKLIFHFVKEKGYTLQGAKDKLKGGVKESEQVKVEVIDKLKNIKDQLLKIKDSL